MCYAHPNGDRGSRYHYHVWSPCLSTCTGESELIGIALDGFPIYGPGINPETGKVWSQSDMDLCGGRQDKNGKYAYYTTVDFPYMLQCYRGHTDQTENLVNGKRFKNLSGSLLVDRLYNLQTIEILKFSNRQVRTSIKLWVLQWKLCSSKLENKWQKYNWSNWTMDW